MSSPAKRILHQTVQRLRPVVPNGSTAKTSTSRVTQGRWGLPPVNAHRNLGSIPSTLGFRQRRTGFASSPVCLYPSGSFASTTNGVIQASGAHGARAGTPTNVQQRMGREATPNNPEVLNALRDATGPVSKYTTYHSPHPWATLAYRGYATGSLSNEDPGSSQASTANPFRTTEPGTTKSAKDTGPTPLSSEITVHFILRDGSQQSVKAPVGSSLLEVAHANQINVEGACEASLACSTCHVILDEPSFNKLPEASEREEDLLDMAPHLSDTSRLSCQVRIIPDLDGMTVRLPLSTLNFYVDGHLPAPH